MIGYYVHHHGSGHRRRFEAIRSVIDADLVAVSQFDMTASAPGSVTLPNDVGGDGPLDHTAGGALHWAPLDVSIAGPRLVRFAMFLDDVRPAGMVVDVSVEAALTSRLAGVPVVYVRQHGDRRDDAHHLAYRSARRLLAPWPVELEHPQTPHWVVAKTDYSGYVVEPTALDRSSFEAEFDDIVVMSGTGGGSLSDHVARRIAQTTGRRVFTAGPDSSVASRRARRGDVIHLGWTDQLPQLLASSPIVVATAGNNTIALAARSGCALITTPMDRPFGEQLTHARRLDDIGAAVCVEHPQEVDDWAPLVELAMERRGVLSTLGCPGGAARAARSILDAFGGG